MRRLFVLCVFLVVFVFSGCKVEVALSVEKNTASGTAIVDVESFLVAYWKDLSVNPDASVFDTERLADIDKQYKALDITGIDIPSDNRIVLKFVINDFSLLTEEIARISGKKAFRIDGNNFVVDADRELVLWFLSMMLGDITTAEGFLPPSDISEEESAEYFTWVFEDYAARDEILSMLKNTGLSLEFLGSKKSAWIPFMPVISGKSKTYKIGLAR
ncbi:hypothetical protein WKV44_01860 [Spirochaetia bacterium 38H-sp]|uniref:Lipoprotein n=1 Tax=Rarispira pelagica TaxID=3141764 RepID=A0ABU9U9D8_9SPIR